MRPVGYQARLGAGPMVSVPWNPWPYGDIANTGPRTSTVMGTVDVPTDIRQNPCEYARLRGLLHITRGSQHEAGS